ncbi:MAG: STAS domain-containing protein [Acidobacteriota bacterium]
MEIRVKQEDGVALVMLGGRLDAASSPELEERLSEVLHSGACALVLNVSGLTHISSAGLRCILFAGKTIKARNGRIALTGAQGMVMDVLKTSGFADILPTYPSDEDALGDHSEW